MLMLSARLVFLSIPKLVQRANTPSVSADWFSSCHINNAACLHPSQVVCMYVYDHDCKFT